MFADTAGMEKRNSPAVLRHKIAVRELKNIVIVFTAISFLGWCIEMLSCFFLSGGWYDRGFLTLPLCTIYGTAAVAYYYLFGLPQNPRFLKWRISVSKGAVNAVLRYLYYFLATALFAAILEYLTSFFFDSAFSVRLWYYEGYAYNISGYVSLGFTLIWGALSTAFMRFGFLPIFRGAALIPEKTITVASAVIIAALLADYAFSYIFLAAQGHLFTLF